MAKLKLPFELEKPSSNEYVTQASEIGLRGTSIDKPLTNVMDLPINITANETGVIYQRILLDGTSNVFNLYIDEASTIDCDSVIVGINGTVGAFAETKIVLLKKGQTQTIVCTNNVQNISFYFGSTSNVTSWGSLIGLVVSPNSKKIYDTEKSVERLKDYQDTVSPVFYADILSIGCVISDGTVNSDVHYSTTDYIPVRAEIIKTNGSIFRVAYYNENYGKKYYSEGATINETYYKKSSYVRISFANSANNYESLIIYYDNTNSQDISTLKTGVYFINETLTSFGLADMDGIVSGEDLVTGCLISDGTVNSDNRYKTTDYINVRGGIPQCSGTITRIAYYDSNKAKIHYQESGTINVNYYNGSAYIRMTFKNSENDYSKLAIIFGLNAQDVYQNKQDIIDINSKIGEYTVTDTIVAGSPWIKRTWINNLRIKKGEKFNIQFFTDANINLNSIPCYFNDVRGGFIGNNQKISITFDDALATTIGSDTITTIGFLIADIYIISGGTVTANVETGLAAKVGSMDDNVLLVKQFENTAQINDSMHSTSASAAQIAYNKETAMVGVVTHGGYKAYGEASQCVYLDLFQLSNPYAIRHKVICEKGQPYVSGGNALGNVSEVNVLYIGNETWRVFAPMGGVWRYRDYHFDTDILDDAVTVKWDDNTNVSWGNNLYVKAYLEDRGFTCDSYAAVLTSSLYRDANGRIYGAVSGDANQEPILYYSDDNMATIVPFLVYPQKCSYEASMCIIDGTIYVIGRGNGGSNPNTFGYSSDNGANWTITNRGGDNNRPRIYAYNGKCLIFHGVSERKKFMIKYGNDFETADILYYIDTPFGCCYASLLVQNGRLYMAYSDGQTNLVENWSEHPDDGRQQPYKDALKFIQLGKI